jgi:Family of unknown function (DUF6152)
VKARREIRMKNKAVTISLMAVVLCMASAPLFAHHGTAAFETDPAKRLVLKATVTEWYWANPHCFLRFDVEDQGGQVTHWVAETSTPSDMTDRGWTHDSFRPGDHVTVTLRPVKGGRPVGSIVEVALPNGKTLSTQLPQAAKPAEKN